MVHTEATYRAWITLHGSWQAANREGRIARAEATRKLQECANGDGDGPSAADLREVARLEQVADGLCSDLGKAIDKACSDAFDRKQ